MLPAGGRPNNPLAAARPHIIAPTRPRPPTGPASMDKKTMTQVLVPAAAAAGVVLLVGVLIALGNGGGADSATTKAAASGFDTTGTTLTLPPLDAPEWKPGPGGMQVWDVVEGGGDALPPGASVTCHYTGWFKDGAIFDSSVKRNEPAEFSLNGVIPGWTKGLPGMKVGGVRRLNIPYALAYGESGKPPAIPPKADLVFEVKLLRINNH